MSLVRVVDNLATQVVVRLDYAKKNTASTVIPNVIWYDSAGVFYKFIKIDNYWEKAYAVA